MLSVLDRGHHLALGRAVAGQLVCNQNARGAPLLLQQLSQQAFGGPFVPPALHQDVEHDAGLVDREPQPVLLAGNFDGNLVEVPLVSSIGQPPPDLVGEVLAELERPLRTLAWLTMMSRAASISSTMRRLRGKRKY